MTTSKSTNKTNDPSPAQSKATDSRWTATIIVLANLLILAVAGFFAHRACADTGWLFGWLIGASQSSVTNTVVPLILAVITGTVFTLVAKSIEKLSSERIWWSLMTVSALCYLTVIFVGRTTDGLREGVEVRMEAKLRSNLEPKLKKDTVKDVLSK